MRTRPRGLGPERTSAAGTSRPSTCVRSAGAVAPGRRFRLRSIGSTAGNGAIRVVASRSTRTPTFLGSSMAEHPAVNRRVAGSSPARGASLRMNAGEGCLAVAASAAKADLLAASIHPRASARQALIVCLLTDMRAHHTRRLSRRSSRSERSRTTSLPHLSNLATFRLSATSRSAYETPTIDGNIRISRWAQFLLDPRHARS